MVPLYSRTELRTHWLLVPVLLMGVAMCLAFMLTVLYGCLLAVAGCGKLRSLADGCSLAGRP